MGIEKLCFGNYEINLLYCLFLGTDNGLTKINKLVCHSHFLYSGLPTPRNILFSCRQWLMKAEETAYCENQTGNQDLE